MGNRNRWWEAYLTRYLIGSIVGAFCLLYLMKSAEATSPFINTLRDIFNIYPSPKITLLKAPLIELFYPPPFSKNSSIFKSIESLGGSGLILLGTAGFGYCYLVSAPLTLLHYLRKTNLFTPKSYLCPSVKNAYLLIICIIFWVASFTLFIEYPKYSYHAAIVLFSSFILIAIFAVLTNASRTAVLDSIDLNAIKAKKKPSIDTSTYKDLSEHGNAYSIVILLIITTRFLSQKNAPSSNEQFRILIMWIGLGAICWYLARTIENWFIKEVKEISKK